MFRKKYYFVLVKNSGSAATSVEMFMYQKPNKKFYLAHSFSQKYCYNYFVAKYLWFLFNLPGWLAKNGNQFGYVHTTGRIFLRKQL